MATTSHRRDHQNEKDQEEGIEMQLLPDENKSLREENNQRVMGSQARPSNLVSPSQRVDVSNIFTPPEKRFCKSCMAYQPYRTKHCSVCQCCIAKFDHHCYFIGELTRGLHWRVESKSFLAAAVGETGSVLFRAGDGLLIRRSLVCSTTAKTTNENTVFLTKPTRRCTGFSLLWHCYLFSEPCGFC